MSNTFEIMYSPSGQTNLVAVVYSDLLLINGSTGTTMADTDGNVPNARISMSDTGHSERYVGTIPANTPAGDLTVRIFTQAGGSLARSDLSVSNLKGQASFYWNGTAVIGDGDNSSLLAAILNIQNNTFVSTNIPQVLERPDAGSDTVPFTILFNDETGSPADVDASALPAITVVNDAGASVASHISGLARASTGMYTFNWTRGSNNTIEAYHFNITATVNGKARRYVTTMQLVDTTAIDFTSSDRTLLTNAATAAVAMVADYFRRDTGSGSDIVSVTQTTNAVVDFVGPANTGLEYMQQTINDIHDGTAIVSADIKKVDGETATADDTVDFSNLVSSGTPPAVAITEQDITVTD